MAIIATIKKSFASAVRRKLFLSVFILLTACGGGSGSDAGYQDDQLPPVASAVAISIPQISSSPNHYRARSNSEVLLTAKDSDSETTPILSFEWTQTQGPSVALVERSVAAVAFNTPDVNSTTVFGFQILITDANGITDTDTLTIEVDPVADPAKFLEDPNTPASELYLLAALRGGQDTGASEQLFSITVKTIAHWRNRLGVMDELEVNEQEISNTFPANFSSAISYVALTEPRNPLLKIDLVRLDVDDINQHFEESDRDRRLDVYEIPNAYLTMEITVYNYPLVDFELLALDNFPLVTNVASRQIISINDIGQTIGVTAAENGALLQSWTSASSVNLTTASVRRKLGLDTAATARAYYNLIDASGELATLSGWLKNAGFTDANGEAIDDPDNAHALYVNNFDLGFGRDMYSRKAANGNVYSYVINYPTIEAGMEQRGEFAVVAMEYSENPDPEGTNAKIVKFFAFVPDERTGEFTRVPSMNFDGNGERFVPAVCTVCHQSYPGDRDYTSLADADLDASFIPWDADSFIYSHAQDPLLIEKTINTNNFTAEELEEFSRDSQESEIRKLNLYALATYIDDTDRYEASIDLIHGWYGDEDLSYPVDELPNNSFNGNYVPVGWAGEEELYLSVFTRTCRICHTQFLDKTNNFDSYAKVIANKEGIITRVFEQGMMPAARVSMDRFWIPLVAGESSSAELLYDHLIGLGDIVPTVPGLPVPAISADISDPTIDDTIILDASKSYFSQHYEWAMTIPAGSTVQLGNDTGLITSFSPDIAGGTYVVTLTTTNEHGETASTTQEFVTADRAPVAECITANTSALASVYKLSNVAVVSNITNTGDGGVTIDSVLNGTYGTASIDTGGQTITYVMNDPFIRGSDVIEYQLVDGDGSLSTTSNSLGCIATAPSAGFGTISIDSTPAGTTAAGNVTAAVDAVNNASEIDIAWSAVTGISVQGYNVYPNLTAAGSPLNGSVITDTSYTDSGLTANTLYNYSVETVINSFISNPSTASATTASLTPSSLVATNTGASTADETQIGLTWNIPPAGAATVVNYEVFRDASSIATPTSNSYNDTSLTPGTAYSYRVLANDGTQDSPLSNTPSQTTRPLAPALATPTAGVDARSDINLSWTAPSPLGQVDAYAIYRGAIEIARVGITPTTFSDTGLTPNTNFSYYITSVVDNGGGLEKLSALSNTNSLSTQPAGAAEATNLIAIRDGVNDATEIDLSWTVPIAFIDEGYNIYRTKGAGIATLIDPDANPATPTVPALSTSYTDNDPAVVSNASSYDYQIAAIFDGTEQTKTAVSAPATTTTLSLVPTSLANTGVTTTTTDFNWASPAASEDASFAIARSDDGGINYSVDLGTVTCCSVSDTGRTAGTEYFYRVTATQGSDSASSTIAISTLPNTPTVLAATTISTSQINLSWTASAGNVAIYNVYRDGVWIDDVTAPTVTYNDTVGLSSGTDYSYTVKALYNSVESDSSNTANETTVPSAPISLTASDGSSLSQITLSWTAPSGDIDSYEVYLDGSGTALTTIAAPTVTYNHSRSSGQGHSYTVTAVANGHESVVSTADTGATKPATPAAPALAVFDHDRIDVSGYGVACNGTGGNAISYSISESPNEVANTTTAITSVAVSGLTGNTSYTFTVAATCNGITSAVSAASSSVKTLVSYADNIFASDGDGPGEGRASTCGGSSCHSGSDSIQTRFAGMTTTYPCIESNISLCSGSSTLMSGEALLTVNEILLIRKWIGEGAKDN